MEEREIKAMNEYFEADFDKDLSLKMEIKEILQDLHQKSIVKGLTPIENRSRSLFKDLLRAKFND